MRTELEKNDEFLNLKVKEIETIQEKLEKSQEFFQIEKEELEKNLMNKTSQIISNLEFNIKVNYFQFFIYFFNFYFRKMRMK